MSCSANEIGMATSRKLLAQPSLSPFSNTRRCVKYEVIASTGTKATPRRMGDPGSVSSRSALPAARNRWSRRASDQPSDVWRAAASICSTTMKQAMTLHEKQARISPVRTTCAGQSARYVPRDGVRQHVGQRREDNGEHDRGHRAIQRHRLSAQRAQEVARGSPRRRGRTA